MSQTIHKHIDRQTDIVRSARVMQLEGIFDVPPSEKTGESWNVNITLPDSWNVGVIVGPSGAGKTTVARELFGDSVSPDWDWPADRSIVDGFPAAMRIKDITALLSSVGFSSPPAWLRPFHVLSNGEKFRVHMARTLAEMPGLCVVDEFSSVVDRTVAQIGSSAIAKTVRRRDQKFIAVTCHYDVLQWLEPDWVLQPHTGEFTDRRCLQRPAVDLVIRRVHPSAWDMFRRYHYLNTELNKAARCFVAFLHDRPVAFTSWLHFPHGSTGPAKNEHRTVCLPDFQGISIGIRLSEYIAGVIKAVGFRVFSTTGNPAMLRARAASSSWRMHRTPSGRSGGRDSKLLGMNSSRATGRMTAGFEYIGPAADGSLARALWGA